MSRPPYFSDARVSEFLTDCFFGNLERMAAGIAEGLDVNLDRGGECPLEGTIINHDLEPVKLLLDHGADVFRHGLLHQAIGVGYIEIVAYMLQWARERDPVRFLDWINEPCAYDHAWTPTLKRARLQWTPLEWAVVRKRSFAMTSLLLEAGANPEVISPRSRHPKSMVVQAVLDGRPDIAGALLMAGADAAPLEELKIPRGPTFRRRASAPEAAPWRAYWAQKALEDSLPQAEATEATEVPRKRF